MLFSDQTVIVTGGAKGIGAGCVRVFHAQGGNIGLLDRDQQAGEQLAHELNQQRENSVLFLPCDVAQFDDFEQCIDQIAEHFGQIDSIINNAGVHPAATSIDDFTIDQMQDLMNVNFLSTYAGAKFAMPHLRKTKGTIVNISSMTAVLGQHLSTAYCATKGAQVSFTKALALEAGPQGIRVNAVLPSNVDTPLMREWAQTLDDPQSALDRVASLQVFNRMATPEEIGRVCLFLATEQSSFLTGQAIEADGGAALDY
ncbi:MAG: glucose 1-dehydrogenase [Planctomycetaceae bacterium]|nr:glucose 1-dehydrogenase [Planctomycetaceae bacterium]